MPTKPLTSNELPEDIEHHLGDLDPQRIASTVFELEVSAAKVQILLESEQRLQRALACALEHLDETRQHVMDLQLALNEAELRGEQ